MDPLWRTLLKSIVLGVNTYLVWREEDEFSELAVLVWNLFSVCNSVASLFLSFLSIYIFIFVFHLCVSLTFFRYKGRLL